MKGYQLYRVCIQACQDCAAICRHCAISCIAEPQPGRFAECIQHTLECSAICTATAQIMSLNGSKIKELAKLCAAICDECAEHCSMFEEPHCQECAELCRKCADACAVI